jgi:hypothetical protein
MVSTPMTPEKPPVRPAMATTVVGVKPAPCVTVRKPLASVFPVKVPQCILAESAAVFARAMTRLRRLVPSDWR